MIRDLLSDLRYSLRMLRRSPVFSITAVAALTLGIGANTAIFTVVNAVLLKRLPYPDSDRIVIFTTRTPAGSFAGASTTKLNIWKEEGGAFRDVSGYRFRFLNLRGGAKTEQISVGEVSTDFSDYSGRRSSADARSPPTNNGLRVATSPSSVPGSCGATLASTRTRWVRRSGSTAMPTTSWEC